MSILSNIKSFDFLGPEIKFRINKQEIFKTVFGGMISILYYIAFLSFFILFGGEFFYKKNPKIVSQVLKDLTPNKTFELSKDNFFLAFRLTSFEGSIPNININPTNCKLTYTTLRNKEQKIIDLPIKNCEQSDFVLFNISNKISDYYCADFSSLKNQIVIGGGYDTYEIFYGSLLLQIGINQNLFNDFGDKHDATKARKYLDYIQFGIFPQAIVPQPIFDPNNYTTPLRLEAKHVLSALSFDSYVQDQVFLSDHVVETDSGVLFDSVDNTTMTGFGRMQTFITGYNQTDYAAVYEMSITYDNEFYQSTRGYTKFQDLLGNINGFMEMVMFVFSFLISFNSDYRLNKHIANKLIYIVDSDRGKSDVNNLNHHKITGLSAPVKNKSNETENILNLRNVNTNNLNIMNSKGKIKKNDSQILNNIENKSNANTQQINENKIELEKINDDSSRSSVKIKADENISDINNANLNLDKSNNKIFLPELKIENEESEESLKLKIKFAKEVGKKHKERGKALEYSFLDHLFKGKICRYKHNYDEKRPNRIIAETITDKVFKKFDILFYLRILNEFENVTKTIFDHYQLDLLRSISKKVYFYKLKNNEKKIEFIRDEKAKKENDLIFKHFSELNKSKENSFLDSKLLNVIDRIFSY